MIFDDIFGDRSSDFSGLCAKLAQDRAWDDAYKTVPNKLTKFRSLRVKLFFFLSLVMHVIWV